MIIDKLDILYKIVGVKEITVYLSLLETKTYPKFYASLIKKVLLEILLYKI